VLQRDRGRLHGLHERARPGLRPGGAVRLLLRPAGHGGLGLGSGLLGLGLGVVVLGGGDRGVAVGVDLLLLRLGVGEDLLGPGGLLGVGGLGELLGDVGTVAPVLDDGLVSGLGVHAERTAVLRGREELLGHLERELVRAHAFGQIGTLGYLGAVLPGDHALEIRTVAADPDVDRAPL